MQILRLLYKCEALCHSFAPPLLNSSSFEEKSNKSFKGGLTTEEAKKLHWFCALHVDLEPLILFYVHPIKIHIILQKFVYIIKH